MPRPDVARQELEDYVTVASDGSSHIVATTMALADRYAVGRALQMLDAAVLFVPVTHWRQKEIKALREALKKEVAE